MTTKAYAYRRFKSREYDFEVDDGLKAGQPYQDVTLTTLEGKKVQLSDYLSDKPLVLETGSMTCPMYAQSVPPMMKLIEKYPGLDHVLLYVREAHPGEMQPQHKTQEDKIGAARKTKQRYDERRTILVDDVEGTAHRFYGTLPNSIFVISPDGKILFRSLWNNAPEMDAVFGAISRGETVQSRELHATPPVSLGTVRTLLMGGGIAIVDFIISLPSILAKHKKAGNV